MKSKFSHIVAFVKDGKWMFNMHYITEGEGRLQGFMQHPPLELVPDEDLQSLMTKLVKEEEFGLGITESALPGEFVKKEDGGFLIE